MSSLGHGALTNAIAFHTLALALCSSQVEFLAEFSQRMRHEQSSCHSETGVQAAIFLTNFESSDTKYTACSLINLMSTGICVNLC